ASSYWLLAVACQNLEPRQKLAARSSKLLFLVQPRLPRRPGLPSPMYPQPLVGIAAHVVLGDFRKQLGVGDDIFFVVAGAHKVDGGIKPQTVFSQDRVPNSEAGNHRGIGAQGDTGQAAGRARRN